MDQFNRDVYKKETLAQQFFRSCLGKIIILAAILAVLTVIAVMTTPTDAQMEVYTEDNIHECLQDNQEAKNDAIDETFSNIRRTFTLADTTLTNREVYDAYKAYNTTEVYRHPAYCTTYLRNTAHPQGVRVGIGIFGLVISTIFYEDLVLDLGPVRGEFNEKLIQDQPIPDDLGENPNLKPYHYRGNPDD